MLNIFLISNLLVSLQYKLKTKNNEKSNLNFNGDVTECNNQQSGNSVW